MDTHRNTPRCAVFHSGVLRQGKLSYQRSFKAQTSVHPNHPCAPLDSVTGRVLGFGPPTSRLTYVVAASSIHQRGIVVEVSFCEPPRRAMLSTFGIFCATLASCSVRPSSTPWSASVGLGSRRPPAMQSCVASVVLSFLRGMRRFVGDGASVKSFTSPSGSVSRTICDSSSPLVVACVVSSCWQKIVCPPHCGPEISKAKLIGTRIVVSLACSMSGLLVVPPSPPIASHISEGRRQFDFRC